MISHRLVLWAFLASCAIAAPAHAQLTPPAGGGSGITALTGDCAASGSGSVATVCTKTSGVAFAPSATTDTTNAANISSGVLAAAQGGAGTITGALKGSGAGVVSQAAATDLSNGVTGSGAVVLVTSPTLVSPSLGSATATQLTLGTNTLTTSGSTLIVSGSLSTGGPITIPSTSALNWSSRSKALSMADGSITLENNAGTGFTSLQFGGVTTSFPEILRVGVGLEIALADGSAATSLQVAALNATTLALTTPLPITSGGTGIASLPTGILVGAGTGAITAAATTGSGSVVLATSPAVTGITTNTLVASGAVSGNPINAGASGINATGPIFGSGGFRLTMVQTAVATLTLAVTVNGYIFTGTTATWTLPAASGGTNVFFFLKNRGTGVVTINANAAASEIYSSAAVSTIAMAAGTAVMLVGDGTFWNVE